MSVFIPWKTNAIVSPADSWKLRMISSAGELVRQSLSRWSFHCMKDSSRQTLALYWWHVTAQPISHAVKHPARGNWMYCITAWDYTIRYGLSLSSRLHVRSIKCKQKMCVVGLKWTYRGSWRLFWLVWYEEAVSVQDGLHRFQPTQDEEKYMSTFLIWKAKTDQPEKVNSFLPCRANPSRGALRTTEIIEREQCWALLCGKVKTIQDFRR